MGVEPMMIDKSADRVLYGALSFGGMSSEYKAPPWNALRYNEWLGA